MKIGTIKEIGIDENDNPIYLITINGKKYTAYSNKEIEK